MNETDRDLSVRVNGHFFILTAKNTARELFLLAIVLPPVSVISTPRLLRFRKEYRTIYVLVLWSSTAHRWIRLNG